MKAWMQKACTGEGIRGERNQHKVRVHDVWGSCHATVMLCLTCLGLVAAVDVTTFDAPGINMSAFHIPKHHYHNKQTIQTAQIIQITQITQTIQIIQTMSMSTDSVQLTSLSPL